MRAGMKFKNKKKFRCGIPAYTGRFYFCATIVHILCNKRITKTQANKIHQFSIYIYEKMYNLW
jgi:hypothetical protein